MERSTSNVKNILIFFQKKVFSLHFSVQAPKIKKILILQETETANKFLIFSHKKGFLTFPETET